MSASTSATTGYGRCTGCDQLKALDHRGHPYPHNRYSHERASLRTQRYAGEHTPARKEA